MKKWWQWSIEWGETCIDWTETCREALPESAGWTDYPYENGMTIESVMEDWGWWFK